MKDGKQTPTSGSTGPDSPPKMLPMLEPIPVPPGHHPTGGGALKNMDEETVKVVFDL